LLPSNLDELIRAQAERSLALLAAGRAPLLNVRPARGGVSLQRMASLAECLRASLDNALAQDDPAPSHEAQPV
jgi:hypothetical protein